MKKILLWLLFFPMLSHAETIKWQYQNGMLEIGNRVEVLEDPTGNLSFSDVSSPGWQNKFIPSKNINLILGYTESVFWVKFSFENVSPDNLVLEVAQAGLPDCDFYERINDSSTIIYKAGSKTPVHQKVIKSSFQVFPLAYGKHDYYIRLTTNSGPIPLRIDTYNNYDARSLTQKFVYGIYLGLMLFVFLNNLFFFFSLRNFLYLANAFNVIIFISYSMLVVDGFATYFFPNIDMLFWYTFIPPFGVTIQTIYSLLFLEVKKYSPAVYRFVIGVIVIYAIWFILKFFLPFHIVQPVNTLQALLSFFIVGYMSIKVGKKGNKFGYYFALTYFVYFLLVLTEATYINTGRPAYILGFSYSGYATVVEALVLSFLLVRRFEWEKEEIERLEKATQLQLFEKTVENERIVREQNATLEKRVEERTRTLENTVKDLQSAQAQLIQSEKMASLGELTAGVAHEIQNPLNFVNNFSELNIELIADLKAEHAKAKDERDEILEEEIVRDLEQNLEKINYHGKRADAIVKGMLQHSRSGSGQKEPTNINKLCDEYIRLSFHGLRAKDKSFSADFKTDFDEHIGKIDVVPQDIGRVLLNLFNNAFYAVNEKLKAESLKPDADINAYKPAVSVQTKKLINKIEISVSDNGNGIPQNVIDKIFQPFFTTKPSGHGTGLGLSLSYDIIKAHGGEIKVESKASEGTTFIIQLPVFNLVF